MVEANAFARSLVVISLEVNNQRTSHSSVLKVSKDVSPTAFFVFFYGGIFNPLNSGMQCVSEELARRIRKCKQQSHLK